MASLSKASPTILNITIEKSPTIKIITLNQLLNEDLLVSSDDDDVLKVTDNISLPRSPRMHEESAFFGNNQQSPIKNHSALKRSPIANIHSKLPATPGKDIPELQITINNDLCIPKHQIVIQQTRKRKFDTVEDLEITPIVPKTIIHFKHKFIPESRNLSLEINQPPQRLSRNAKKKLKEYTKQS